MERAVACPVVYCDNKAFALLAVTFTSVERFRGQYASCVSRLRALLSTHEPYDRPTHSRPAHPFVQASLPEVTRDKFQRGRILSKHEFAACATSRPSPHQTADAEAAGRLPADLTIAIDTVLHLGADVAYARDARLDELADIAAELEPLRAALDECKCDSAQAIASEFNAAWAAAVVDAMAWPDFHLPARYIVGFPVVFDIPDSGVFRAAEQPAEISPSDFRAGNTRMVAHIFDTLHRAMGDPDQRERREQCWAKTKKEIAAGLVGQPVSRRRMDRTYGRGRWRCLSRNAILQKGKWRCIDNAKSNKANKAQSLHERITCGRADFPAMVTREFARRMRAAPRRSAIHKRRTRMEHGTMDLKAAYRHVPTSQPEYTNVAVIDTDRDEVVICEVPGHNFGLASAVINFNRYPELAVAAARRLLWTVSEHYYDDVDTAEPSFARGSGQRALERLCGAQFFGFGFDDEQTSAMSGANDYLGVSTDLTPAPQGYVLMEVSLSRRKKIQALVDEAIRAHELRSGMAASIFGKARFMLSPCYGGLGKACLAPVQLRSRQKSARLLDSELRESLEFISFACDALPPVRLPVLPDDQRAVVIFVDAEGKKAKGSRRPTGHLGFVVYHPVHGTRHAYAPVPPSFTALLDAIKLRQTYIGQFELLGAITPFVSLPPDWLHGRPVELWIDNSSAMSALVKDYSGKPDCSRLVNTFHFAVARLGLASLWIDFVNSESNPADVPSRAHEEVSELAEYGERVHMVVPDFADADGSWLHMVDIARSVW